MAVSGVLVLTAVALRVFDSDDAPIMAAYCQLDKPVRMIAKLQLGKPALRQRYEHGTGEPHVAEYRDVQGACTRRQASAAARVSVTSEATRSADRYSAPGRLPETLRRRRT